MIFGSKGTPTGISVTNILVLCLIQQCTQCILLIRYSGKSYGKYMCEMYLYMELNLGDTTTTEEKR